MLRITSIFEPKLTKKEEIVREITLSERQKEVMTSAQEHIHIYALINDQTLARFLSLQLSEKSKGVPLIYYLPGLYSNITDTNKAIIYIQQLVTGYTQKTGLPKIEFKEEPIEEKIRRWRKGNVETAKAADEPNTESKASFTDSFPELGVIVERIKNPELKENLQSIHSSASQFILSVSSDPINIKDFIQKHIDDRIYRASTHSDIEACSDILYLIYCRNMRFEIYEKVLSILCLETTHISRLYDLFKIKEPKLFLKGIINPDSHKPSDALSLIEVIKRQTVEAPKDINEGRVNPVFGSNRIYLATHLANHNNPQLPDHFDINTFRIEYTYQTTEKLPDGSKSNIEKKVDKRQYESCLSMPYFREAVIALTAVSNPEEAEYDNFLQLISSIPGRIKDSALRGSDTTIQSPKHITERNPLPNKREQLLNYILEHYDRLSLQPLEHIVSELSSVKSGPQIRTTTANQIAQYIKQFEFNREIIFGMLRREVKKESMLCAYPETTSLSGDLNLEALREYNQSYTDLMAKLEVISSNTYFSKKIINTLIFIFKSLVSDRTIKYKKIIEVGLTEEYKVIVLTFKSQYSDLWNRMLGWMQYEGEEGEEMYIEYFNEFIEVFVECYRNYAKIYSIDKTDKLVLALRGKNEGSQGYHHTRFLTTGVVKFLSGILDYEKEPDRRSKEQIQAIYTLYKNIDQSVLGLKAQIEQFIENERVSAETISSYLVFETYKLRNYVLEICSEYGIKEEVLETLRSSFLRMSDGSEITYYSFIFETHLIKFAKIQQREVDINKFIDLSAVNIEATYQQAKSAIESGLTQNQTPEQNQRYFDEIITVLEKIFSSGVFADEMTRGRLIEVLKSKTNGMTKNVYEDIINYKSRPMPQQRRAA